MTISPRTLRVGLAAVVLPGLVAGVAAPSADAATPRPTSALTKTVQKAGGVAGRAQTTLTKTGSRVTTTATGTAGRVASTASGLLDRASSDPSSVLPRVGGLPSDPSSLLPRVNGFPSDPSSLLPRTDGLGGILSFGS